MKTNIEWLIPERVALLTVVGDVDVQDLHEMDAAIVRILDEGTQPVHIICDTSGMGNVPNSVNDLRNSQTYFTHPKLGWLLVIGLNPVTSFMARVVGNVTKMNVKTANSVEEAQQILGRIDSNLQFASS